MEMFASSNISGTVPLLIRNAADLRVQSLGCPSFYLGLRGSLAFASLFFRSTILFRCAVLHKCCNSVDLRECQHQFW